MFQLVSHMNMYRLSHEWYDAFIALTKSVSKSYQCYIYVEFKTLNTNDIQLRSSEVNVHNTLIY